MTWFLVKHMGLNIHSVYRVHGKYNFRMANVTARDTENYDDLPEALFPATGKFRLSNNSVINLLSVTSRARTAFVSNLFITDILRFPPLPLLPK